MRDIAERGETGTVKTVRGRHLVGYGGGDGGGRRFRTGESLRAGGTP
ncbi:hypothetical protein ABT173_05610 [Streptomyces sp. NPDC001795]